MSDRPLGFVPRLAAVLGAAAITLVVVAALALGIRVLLIGFGGTLLGLFLLALRDALAHRTRLRPAWSLVVVVLASIALFAGLAALMVPSIARQLDELAERAPALWAEARGALEERAWGQRLLAAVEDDPAIAELIRAGAGAAAGFAVFALGVAFVGLFVAMSPGLYAGGLVALLPRGARERGRRILAEMGHMLRWFLVARAISMAFVGVASAIALSILGVPLAPLLALLAGVFTFVPYLGPIAAAVLITLVALVEGGDTAIYALAVYTIIQLVEGYLFTPLVLQRVVHIAPAVTILAQIAGGILLGVAGVALATPFVAAAQVLVRRAYREDLLGEPPEPEPEPGGDDARGEDAP